MPSSRTTTGLPPGVQVGPTGPRLLAALVEVGPVWLLTVLALVFGFLLDGRLLLGVLFVLLALAWGVVVWAQRATKAAGPGMRLDSVQIVGFSDGRPLGWGRVLIRWLVFAGLTISVVGLIAMVVVMSRHPRRQGWHDLAANAVVIKERPLAPPRSRPAVARSAPRRSTPSRSTPRPSTPRPSTPRPSTPGPSTPESTPASVPAAHPAPVSVAASVTPAAGQVAVTSPSSPPTSRSTSPVAAETAADASTDAESAAEVAAQEEVAAAQPEYEWSLRLDDGRDVGVAELVLLGRNPQPRVGEEDATLIKVVDQTRTVSKSHLAVGVDARGLYVMDRGSTNGTVVTGPDGGQRPCPPGDLIDVPAGSVISFGDHWLEVRRPGG